MPRDWAKGMVGRIGGVESVGPAALRILKIAAQTQDMTGLGFFSMHDVAKQDCTEVNNTKDHVRRLIRIGLVERIRVGTRSYYRVPRLHIAPL
jgi:hypothetical protein